MQTLQNQAQEKESRAGKEVRKMDEVTNKAIEVVKSILKDFNEDEALAVLEIAKVLIRTEF
ncbi:hypothetical protein [Dysgonomonas capnocytophagoides]|uniref:hypothetical protein n=1 Tax=Dysgonomonas capnocytophagoides TaxID=45254 RepID=UPI002A7EBA7E|nr:hypothetical protein [Dysgonomonas capnocytophagoides]